MTCVLTFLILLLTACQPWYRDAQRAGQRATDQKHASKLLAEASTMRSKGDHARAAMLVRRAILDVPDQSADTWLLLARDSFAAGDVAGGRAACRRGMQLFSSDSRFKGLLVEQKLADDLTALAIDESGYNIFDALANDSAFAPHVDALKRAVSASHADTAAAELALWLTHYGIPDHTLLRTARDSVADRIKRDAETLPVLAGLATAAERATAEVAAGRVANALALYSEVYRMLPSSVLDAHFASFAKAAREVTDPESIDPGAYQLAIQGDKDASAGHLGLAIHSYRRAVARAPWWIDARRNLATLYDTAKMGAMADAERSFVDRLSR
jgi:tetratricopeptide (TPR) repeat protein